MCLGRVDPGILLRPGQRLERSDARGQPGADRELTRVLGLEGITQARRTWPKRPGISTWRPTFPEIGMLMIFAIFLLTGCAAATGPDRTVLIHPRTCAAHVFSISVMILKYRRFKNYFHVFVGALSLTVGPDNSAWLPAEHAKDR